MCLWKASQIRHRVTAKKSHPQTNADWNDCSCTTRNLVYSTPARSATDVDRRNAQKRKRRVAVPFPGFSRPGRHGPRWSRGHGCPFLFILKLKSYWTDGGACEGKIRERVGRRVCSKGARTQSTPRRRVLRKVRSNRGQDARNVKMKTSTKDDELARGSKMTVGAVAQLVVEGERSSGLKEKAVGFAASLLERRGSERRYMADL